MEDLHEQASASAAHLIEARLVGRTSIVHIQDGRAFCGTFLCVDSGRNIILANTDEMRLTSEGRTSTRNVGMVMIPGNFIVKVEVQQDAPPAQPSHEEANMSASMAQAGWPDDDDMYS